MPKGTAKTVARFAADDGRTYVIRFFGDARVYEIVRNGTFAKINERETIAKTVRYGKHKYGIAFKDWDFTVAYEDLDAADTACSDAEELYHQVNRWRYMRLGALVPLTLTTLTVCFGIFHSVSTNEGIGILNHIGNGWWWVKFGILLSLIGGGASISFALSSLGSVKGGWMALGAISCFFAIVLLAFAFGEDLIEDRPEPKSGFSIQFDFKKD